MPLPILTQQNLSHGFPHTQILFWYFLLHPTARKDSPTQYGIKHGIDNFKYVARVTFRHGKFNFTEDDQRRINEADDEERQRRRLDSGSLYNEEEIMKTDYHALSGFVTPIDESNAAFAITVGDKIIEIPASSSDNTFGRDLMDALTTARFNHSRETIRKGGTIGNFM